MIAKTGTKKCQWCNTHMVLELRFFTDSLSPYMRYILAFSVGTLYFDKEKVWACPACGRVEEVEF